MAELDSRIPLMAQGPQIQGPMDVAQKGMTMREMALKNQHMQQEGDYKNNLQKMDMIARLTAGVKDQDSYDSALGEASRMGMDVSQLPRAYDRSLVNNLRARSVSYLDQLKNDREQYQLSLEERKVRAMEDKANNSGENLPLDKKHFVGTLATSNANKVAIRNQIESVMKSWDGLSDDQKVYTGQQLIKTLNSTEGKDAVGNQERDVLAGKLQFALGNLTNSNPTQFGRDLEGFKDQALNVSKTLAGAVDSNQKEIDKSMGRTPVASFSPDVLNYSKKHGISPEEAQAIKDQRTAPQQAGR